MNLLPYVTGTVAHWPLQGNLKDTSGVAPDLYTQDATQFAAPSPPGGVEQYAALDTCLQAFKFNGGTQLAAKAVSSALQLTGPFTVQWLMNDAASFDHTFFLCTNPAVRSDPSGLSNLLCLYWSSFGFPGFTDYHTSETFPIGGFHPGVLWETISASNWGYHANHAYCVRRDGAGVVSLYIDGVRVTPDRTLASLGNAAAGNELFFIGGNSGGGPAGLGDGAMGNNSLIADMRVLNYGRSDVDILADAQFVLGGCGGIPVPPVIDGDSGGVTAGGAIVYDAVAAAQFGLSLRLTPRS